MQQVFQRLDIDGSGGIDASELEQALLLMDVESSETVVGFLPVKNTMAMRRDYPLVTSFMCPPNLGAPLKKAHSAIVL